MLKKIAPIAIFFALASYTHAAWLTPPPSKVAQRAMEQALLAESMGQMEKALPLFARAREHYALALKNKPGWRGITLGYVMACVKTGYFHEAEETCRPLLKANRPIDVPMGYVLMAMAYAGLNDPEQALAMLDAFPRAACLRTLTQEIARIAQNLHTGSMTTRDALGQLGAAIRAQGKENGNGLANPADGANDSGGAGIGGNTSSSGQSGKGGHDSCDTSGNG